ncbi:MAG: ABC transporter permease [Bacillota bacterium]|nr:ABC transporter permease [Bacillota bacterium]
MNIKQSFRMALKSIQSSKMRAFLTMLGIIIGVASVIVLVSLMNGVTSDITSRFESMGTNTLTVNVMGRGSSRSFSEEQMEAVITENESLYSGYSPTVSASVTAKVDSSSVTSSVTGVNEMYQELQSLELSSGRFVSYIDCERRHQVCVVGSYLVQELFGGQDPVGETIKLDSYNFTIVGVLEETADSEENSEDHVIYMPYSTAMKISGTGTLSSYMVSLADRDQVDLGVATLENAMYQVFGDEDAYNVTSMSAMIESLSEMTDMMTSVLVGIASISLLVGGIGIMNIMLVSVTERIREIGIRKAVGARRRAILSQFLIEAGTTSSLGGVMGILLGLLMAEAAGVILGMAVVPTIGSILLAFGVSVGIGVIFGYFPAKKAAGLRPIEALRHE